MTKSTAGFVLDTAIVDSNGIEFNFAECSLSKDAWLDLTFILNSVIL